MKHSIPGLGTHVLDAVLAHGLDEIDGAHDVVRVVAHRKLDALAHCLPPSEVYHGVDPALGIGHRRSV